MASRQQTVARRFAVEGRVQGVGFRNYVQKKATQLEVRGWVRNRADGGVEAYAIGTEEQLSAFRSVLERGPLLARVERVSELEADIESLQTFQIKI